MAAGILIIAVTQFNQKPYSGNKTINLNQLLWATPNSDTDDTINVYVADDGSLQYNQYTIDGSITLAGFKALVNAVDAENVITLPLVDVKSVQSPGGGNQVFPLAKYPVGKPYMLNQQFILDTTEILDANGVLTEKEVEYRNNYNDYFSIFRIYASDDSGVDVGGAGEELI